jgi:uncharacterized protein Yka (UPF0111/DUF47 family)
MANLARILRSSDNEFFDLFDEAGRNIARAGDLIEKLLAGYPESAGMAGEIRDCEHEGDRITHDLIQRLNQTFVTPIEREDILQLASALDDIVDYIDEVADYLGLYKVEAPMEQAQALARILRGATAEIAKAVPLIRGFHDIRDQTVEAHRLENEGDRVVREAVAALFEGATDPMVVIRWKDIYERLENAIDATERAAFTLEGIVIKNA